MKAHLAECKTLKLSEMYPDEPRPKSVSKWSWENVGFVSCEPGCPMLEASLERGRELAKEHGW